MAPTVSALIPSTLRPELARAIESVRAQTVPDIEIVVAVDRDETSVSAAERSLLSDADVVVFTGGRRGGGFARNTAVKAASGDWFAFLDDDDAWRPDKIRTQLDAAAASSSPTKTVFSTRVVQSISGDITESDAVPDVTIGPDRRVEDYLFARRVPRLGRAGIFTSTLFLSRRLALAVPWDPSLPRHQDWDWLIRLQEEGGAQFEQLASVGTTISVGSAGSISASPDWEGSLRWARSWRGTWSARSYVDFVAGQPLRYATQSRSVEGIRNCLREIVSTRRLPSIGPAALGLGGFLPRATVLKVLVGRRPSPPKSAGRT